MADYYTLSEEEFNEIMIDVSTYYEIIQMGQSLKFSNNNKLGTISSNAKKKGNTFIGKTNVAFNKNVRIITKSVPLITLSFNLKGLSNHNLDSKNFNAYEFKGGYSSLYFLNEGFKGESKYEKDLETEYVSFNFTAEFFAKLSELYPYSLNAYNQRFTNGETFLLNDSPIPINTEMYRILAQIDRADLLGSAKDMYIDTKVIELLSLQLAHNTRKETNTNCFKLVDKESIIEACRILVSDLNNTPSLKNLAILVGINERKLKEGFKQVYGTTVFEYLFQYKMDIAKQFLLESSLNVNEISLQCGYEYVSHFSTAFKRFYGCSPLTYRNRYL